MTIEQWWFLSVPHLDKALASVYNGHLRGPVTLTPIDSGAVITCFNDLGLLRLGFEHLTFRMRGKRSNPLHHRRGDYSIGRWTAITRLTYGEGVIMIEIYQIPQ